MDSDVEQIKTPRQVLPSLLEVSSGGRLHKLSRSGPTTDDRGLPLSSTTAHAREAKIIAVAAECNATLVAAVKRAYANVNVHKIERVTSSSVCLSTLHSTRPMQHSSWQQESNSH